MKRVMLYAICSLVLIGCTGCEVKETTESRIFGPDVQGVRPDERLSKLKEENEKLQEELYEARNMAKKDKASLARIAKLEDELASQRAKLRAEIERLKGELVKAEKMPKQYKALLVKLAELEASLGYQEAVERAEKALMLRIDDHEDTINRAMVALTTDLLVRIDDIEAAIESQREEIENSKNMSRLYEVAIESQKVAIESLQKLCRMYEADIESQGKSRSGEESPQSKEPEAEEKQRDENHGQGDGVSLPDGL